MSYRYNVQRETIQGSCTFGPTSIASFMNQCDANLFAHAECLRATREGEDVSVTVREGRREIYTYRSAKALTRLGMAHPDGRPMTYSRLVQLVQEILPEHQFDTDNEGQLVIYTGAREGELGYLSWDASLAGT